MVYFDTIHKTMIYYAYLNTHLLLALKFIQILTNNATENEKLTFFRRSHTVTVTSTPPPLREDLAPARTWQSGLERVCACARPKGVTKRDKR